ncbi:MAG: hypothetical protein EHM41_07395 [Chloroflexi bacterium]|nr:MAG: hypothetical protein EHM41_07395 [Chloroflexota bacterium]
MVEGETIEYNGWTLKVRNPEGDGPHPVLLMVHGWKGDEDVMWIFSPRIPKEYLIIAPRGLQESPNGGYGWHDHKEGELPTVDEYRPSATKLLELIQQLGSEEYQTFWNGQANFLKVNLMGFSQGAALCGVFALLYSDRVNKLASLAGYLPLNSNELAASKPLSGKEIFVAHGTQDNIVPIERARQAVEIYEQAGARVIFCEDDIGHKLSTDCFRGLGEYFRK